jgi:transcription elongation GreA/GreB family factor
MSRAFTKEGDYVDQLPDRPISAHPNKVTERGLALIEAALETARREYAEAQTSGDRDALAKAGRELRYWTARRSTAQVASTPQDDGSVHFGSCVAIVRADGRRQSFRIVGEDEADPRQGSISYVSPLARAIVGKGVGEVVTIGEDDIEISSIKQSDTRESSY